MQPKVKLIWKNSIRLFIVATAVALDLLRVRKVWNVKKFWQALKVRNIWNVWQALMDLRAWSVCIAPTVLRGLVAPMLLLLVTLVPSLSSAKKLDWSTGYYNLTAESKNGKGSITSFSTYQISLRMAVLQQLEVSVGYSLQFSEMLSGDMGYGPDLGLFYYPFSFAAKTELQKGQTYIERYDPWRPFLVGQFQQRQYQSVQASYAGFSVGAGTEYWFDSHFAFRLWGNLSDLKGPSEATAKEMNFLGGISIEF